jgi:DNA-binding GntR family transcriptional regulator
MMAAKHTPPETAAAVALSPFQSVPDFVATSLREAIMSGAIVAGAPLRQEDIGQQFGVSRPPVREALKQLETEGLIIYRPRRGYIVASIDPSDVEEIFEIRMLLEERAAFLAAKRRTDDDIRKLEAMAKGMEGMKMLTTDDAAQFSVHNRAFHGLIYQVSGRRLIAEIMQTLENKVERYIRYGSINVGDSERVHEQHRAIVAAFRDGNAKLMGRLCRDHAAETATSILEFLRHAETQPAEKKAGRAG